MKRIVVALPFAWLLGCSTPAQSPRITPILEVQRTPPPDFQRELPLESPQGHLCQLGQSCMTLDPRPFEACLVGTKRCLDKVIEPVLVDTEPPAR
jgi:hypothetical protein